ncbi:sensor histidine kinase [Miniphocaeibacter halophilus]|uniref:Sensor histidine kinase n=1 Tax=Miniphocaeibacter halophilus TaxID=2931922 RepID=A0AC61MSP5_9FIRM|nr:sensor histidine kinase [Miniphocaeibacter halophilus]QQK08577.1 sensor histidine kinase [Miniphocaeibacter halophilus]
MKINRLFESIRDNLLWITIIVITNLFFIFLGWISYPENFVELVYVMILFSIIVMGIVFVVILMNKKKVEEYYFQMLLNPSEENERKLLNLSPKSEWHRIIELGSRLREYRDKVEKSKEDLEGFKEFMEKWVHEIKTPISLMTFVLDNRRDEISQEVYKKLNYARISIDDNVERIMYYGRLGGDHRDYRFERIDLKTTIGDILKGLNELIEVKGINIRLNLNCEYIFSDEKNLRFIIHQIIINSIKYLNKENENLIEISSGEFEEGYYLKIEDNGQGVLESDIPFIFDKGFTGYDLNQKKSTGIGLYLVKRICDEMNIGLEWSSEKDRGFSIGLYFPKIDK